MVSGPILSAPMKIWERMIVSFFRLVRHNFLELFHCTDSDRRPQEIVPFIPTQLMVQRLDT
ncbi:hypothetical protein D3C86_2037430 [compost metagenome]